ncbi:ApeA N-terminal domain 1-containing protein [Burkholderia stagnalis]|uniref:ApeA N-terminal domain 1-containing protein n=1 Tax=Burkholderia stagnalis TaxID=1503054 RepID=UPI000F5764A4|nr:HEPN domain-containing protein [Burkholderia stagnalis]
MSTEIDFSGHYSFDVQVTHDELGELGEATLRFGADHWPHLHFEDWRMYDRFGDDQKCERLIATTKKGDVFTLFDCSVIGYSLAIDYVVAGEVTGDFKAISVRFDDINEWFMPFRRIEEKIDPEAGGADKLKQITVSLENDAQSFTLSTETIVSIDHKGEDHIIHEHVLFNFERADGFFSAKDIKEKPHELSTLLSILTATPLTIVNILTTCKDGKYHYAFFSTFKKQPQDGKSRGWSDYFARKSLFDGRWQTVFENYYRSAYRKVSWVRLAGMQRYDGFWEYKALGYVSLLDKYVDQRTKGQKRKPSKGQELKGTKLHTKLKKVVPQLSEEQESAVFSAVAEIFLKSGDLSFGEQYRLVLDTMDEDIRSIINLTNHDFDQIKSIRDAVAHGDAPDLIESDFGRIGIIVSKIALMLTYWAFMDFGMTPDDFLGCFKNHSHLHLRANVDRVQLARVTESAGFLKLTEEQFDELSKINGIKTQPCFLRYRDGRIEYASHHVDALKAWYRMRKSGIIPVAQIFGQSEEKIKCWGEAFLETETRRLELTQAYFIEST